MSTNQPTSREFELIDAKQASAILGIPYTWLLAQARARAIPHHRLGHYVRFNPDDLEEWLAETRIDPGLRHGVPSSRGRVADSANDSFS